MTQRTLFPTDRPAPRQPGPPEQDRERLANHTQNLLARLQQGPVTTAELYERPDLYGRRFGARAFDLRRLGWIIPDARRVPGQPGVFEYELRGKRE